MSGGFWSGAPLVGVAKRAEHELEKNDLSTVDGAVACAGAARVMRLSALAEKLIAAGERKRD
jgi:hypothetical protein